MPSTKENPVFVFRCGRCGLEYFTRRRTPPAPKCGRCDGTLYSRVIRRPHPDTARLADAEDKIRYEE